MRVAIICYDKPGHLELRKATRAAHVEYLKASGAIAMAGPLLDANGEMCGSLLIVEVEDMAAAEAFAAGDPYGQAGLFESVTLRQWNQTMG